MTTTMISNIINGDTNGTQWWYHQKYHLKYLSNFEMIALMIDEVMFYGNSGGFHGILTFLNINTELKCKSWLVESWQLNDSSLIYFFWFFWQPHPHCEGLDIISSVTNNMYIPKVSYILSRDFRGWTVTKHVVLGKFYEVTNRCTGLQNNSSCLWIVISFLWELWIHENFQNVQNNQVKRLMPACITRVYCEPMKYCYELRS